MTQNTGPDFGSVAVEPTSRPEGSTTEVAKEQTAQVSSSAKEAGQHVAGVARDQAGNVAAEAGRQVRDVIGQARDEVGRQASDQQQRAAGGLRALGTQLDSMATGSTETGLAPDLARQASAKIHELAGWLETREPGTLLDEAASFARRRPGAFLGIALGAGILAGRLTRGLKEEASGSVSPTSPTSAPAPSPTTASAAYTPVPDIPSTPATAPVAAEEVTLPGEFAGSATPTGGSGSLPPYERLEDQR